MKVKKLKMSHVKKFNNGDCIFRIDEDKYLEIILKGKFACIKHFLDKEQTKILVRWIEDCYKK